MRPEMMLALFVIQRMLGQTFIALTGMTLDEWDELNYQRTLACDKT